MKRPVFSFSILVLAAALAACGGKGQANSKAAAGAPGTGSQATAANDDAAKKTPPPLPKDVADLAPIATEPAAGSAQTSPTSSEPAGPASDSAAASASLSGRVAATGELVSPVRSELAVRNPGRVGKVFADKGDRVRRGQPLLQLETEYLALDLKRADADVARAQAAAGDAKRDFDRKRELIGNDSVSRAAYDRSESAYQSAQAAVASAVAGRDLARQRLGDSVLRSPIDGAVSERRTDVGERLGESSVAFVVVQTSPLRLRFQLPERYLAAVHPGQPVRAEVDPYPGVVFTGQVSRIDRVVDPATRTVSVETEIANRDGRLSPGLFARVEIDLTPSATRGGRP